MEETIADAIKAATYDEMLDAAAHLVDLAEAAAETDDSVDWTDATSVADFLNDWAESVLEDSEDGR